MKKIIILSVILLVILPFVLEGSVSLVKIKVTTANVRNGASLDSDIITQVPIDTILELISKTGDWYLVKLPPDETGLQMAGYIHVSCIEELGASQEQRILPAPPAAIPARPVPVAPPQAGREVLFSGISVKLGFMFNPRAGGLGYAWLPGVAYDIGLSRYFSVGFELQPVFRSYSDTDFTLSTIPIMAFGNVKGGLEVIDHLKIFGGGGAGTLAALEFLKIDGDKFTDFTVNFAFHLLSGVEYELETISLFIEYQMQGTVYSSVLWRHFIMLGVRF